MNDDIDNGINHIEDEDRNVDADTNFSNLNVSRLNDLNDDIINNDIKTNDSNNPSLFPATNLFRQTADNLAQAEAMIDEKPLKTPKTAELEKREAEEDEESENKL